MKKLTIIAVMFILLFTLVSCGGESGDSPYVGTWKATVATMDGTEVNVSDVLGQFTLDIKANGTLEMNVNEKNGETSWEETDKGFVVEDNGTTMEFIAEDDKLYVEQSGIKIYFEKE